MTILMKIWDKKMGEGDMCYGNYLLGKNRLVVKWDIIGGLRYYQC